MLSISTSAALPDPIDLTLTVQIRIIDGEAQVIASELKTAPSKWRSGQPKDCLTCRRLGYGCEDHPF
jgi:hypothetical protein